MSTPTSTTRPSGAIKLATRAKQFRSLAERSAAEAFVYLMHCCRVRGTTWPSKVGSGRPTATSPAARAAKLCATTGWRRRFGALTVKSDEAMPTGYRVNTHAVVIRTRSATSG
jgi:hypothetical protein